ncbi:MAG: hypothetical protein HQL95_11295 [Magnetococcales bacterium]|nr:hypothetical protein [Magnetococcales bacterium]
MTSPGTATIPIVTVVDINLILKWLQTHGKWALSDIDPTSTARKVETTCKFSPCRYFYAGKAHPRFGTLAIAYSPEYEHQAPGEANPFDTGGIFLGHIFPFKKMPEADRITQACALITSTRCGIAEWRKKMEQFLHDFFAGDLLRYLNHDTPACSDPAAWPDTLPALHKENFELPADKSADNPQPREFRAWAWEIRLTKATPIGETILFAAATPEAIDEINQTLVDLSNSPNIDAHQTTIATLETIKTSLDKNNKGQHFITSIETSMKNYCLSWSAA